MIKKRSNSDINVKYGVEEDKLEHQKEYEKE